MSSGPRAASLWLVCGMLVACSPRPRSEPGPFEAGLRGLSDEARGLGLEMLSADQTGALLGSLTSQLESAEAWRSEEGPRRLGELLLDAARLERDIDDDRPELALPAGVLQRRRGSCLGLAGVTLIIAERLGLEAHLVLVPGHAFVRVIQEGKAVNVELLRRGEAMPDAWYEDRYRPPPGNPTYLRALGPEEALAVYRFNLASARVDRGQAQEALTEYEEVLAVLPAMAEAHAGKGLVLQKLGRRAEALAAYQAALSANPGVRGVEENLPQLDK